MIILIYYADRKITELEEELKVVGNAMKSHEVGWTIFPSLSLFPFLLLFSFCSCCYCYAVITYTV